MEGRIYRHMSYDTIDKEYTVDPNIDFGAGLYMQIIDPQGGRMLAADIAAELEVSGSDFVVNMQGDLKMINDGGRNPTGGIGKGAIKAAGKAVAEEVVEAIGPISLDIPIGGGIMKVTAEGTKSGSLNYTKNDLEFGIAGDVEVHLLLIFYIKIVTMTLILVPLLMVTSIWDFHYLMVNLYQWECQVQKWIF